jgi:type I restriction enzyme S subunit
MIADLKPYPVMKDSGVPWLGRVPEHWEVLPALATYKPKLVKNTGMVEKTVLSLSYGRIIVKPPEKLRGLVPESFETYQIVDPGNIIVRTTDLQNDHTSLRIGYSPNRGIITSAYLCLRTTDRVSNEFGYQFLNTYDLLKIIYGFGSGLRQNLDFSDIKRMPVLVPPKKEQSAIVRFLDHADRRIRRYIHAKQKLIKLLEEQKQAIIHRAVTRGLDPNVRLKPSGVEWLGDVPEHWTVHRTKVLFRLRTEKSGVAHGHELLSIYTHIGVRPRKELEQKGNKASTTDDYWVVKRGDIIANKLLAWMGAIGVSHYDGVTSPAYDILMPVRELVPDYYHHLFRTKLYLQQFKQRSRGIMDMRLRLYFDQFGQIPIPVPPVDEQAAIVNFYNDATADADRIIGQTQREIVLLREYRIRLIADVVTGKLDVRAAAAKLSEETDESEPLDDAEAIAEGEEETKDADLDAVPEEAEA